MFKNKLKYFRHRLQIDTQIEYAEFLGFSGFSVNRWEKQVSQPDITSTFKIYLKLKERIPDLHMEDLFEQVPD